MKITPITLKPLFYLAILPTIFICSSQIHAGVDTRCSPTTDIQTNTYTACDNLPALTPANDNQTNMLLLLSDLGLAKINIPQTKASLWETEYSTVPFEAKMITQHVKNGALNARQNNINEISDYNEHCNSIKQGAQDFIQQVKANKLLSNIEKNNLIKARQNIKDCDKKNSFITVDANSSLTAQQFSSYLNGIISFYNANFSTATKIFTALKNSNQPWIQETSYYMLVRSSLNEAYQSGVGEYGDLDLQKLNSNLLTGFFNNTTQYLKKYPTGLYAASTRGTLRRGFWLSGRHDLLVNEFVWQINNPKSPFYNLEIENIAYEIDRHIFQSSKFNPKNLKDPFFLAIYDLMQMRKPETSDDTVISWSALNAQKDIFKDQKALFQYLQASHLFYVQNKPQEALKYLNQSQASNSINNYLELSLVLLKGRISEKAERNQNTQKYWEFWLNKAKNDEQRGLFEFMLFPYYVEQQNAERFIGLNAHIKQLSLVKSFIQNKANEKSLMHIVQHPSSTPEQKLVATYTTLNKALIHQNYGLFNQAFQYLPKNSNLYKYSSTDHAPYQDQPFVGNFLWKGATISPTLKCPELSSLTQSLEKKPTDTQLQLCLGEFIRSDNGYNTNNEAINENMNPTFKGAIFKRGSVYKNIIKSDFSPEMKAYALYRAVQCYAPSAINDCLDEDVPKAVRKQWFDQLKQDYPNTSWAQSLKFYW